jgi:hypothetical protein
MTPTVPQSRTALDDPGRRREHTDPPPVDLEEFWPSRRNYSFDEICR